MILILLAVCFWNFYLFDFFERENPQGFIYDFQVLLGGLLAFGAGFFVWFSAVENLKFNKTDIKNKRILEKISFASALRSELRSILYATERLNYICVLKENHKNIQQVIDQGNNYYVCNDKYFTFPFDVIPIFHANLDKIGLLSPDVLECITITSSLIKSAVIQVEQVGIYNLENREICSKKLLFDNSLAVQSMSRAIESTSKTINLLEVYITIYNGKLSEPEPFFNL